MATRIKLNFEGGWSNTNRIWTLSVNSNMIAQDGVMYPYPYYELDSNFTALATDSSAGVVFSDKVYNSSFQDGVNNFESIFLVAQGTDPAPTTLDVDSFVGRKGETELNNTGYNSFSFTFESVLGVEATPIDGLTSFTAFWNPDRHIMTVAYINTIFETTTGFAAQLVVPLTDKTIAIKEMISYTVSPRIFIITEQQFFEINILTGNATLIESELSDLTGLAAGASASDIVWVTGVRDGLDSIGIYNTLTGVFQYHANPVIVNENVAINRVYWKNSGNEMILCTDAGAVFMNPVTGAAGTVEFPNTRIFDVDSPGAGQFYSEVFATNDGIKFINGGGTGQAGQGTFSRVAVRGDAIAGTVFGAALRPSTSTPHQVEAFFIDNASVFSSKPYQQPEFFEDIEAFGNEGETDNSAEWLAPTLGKGIWSGAFVDVSGAATPNPPQLRFRLYNQILRDVIKRTEDRFTYLVSLVGSSNTDSNTVLLEYDNVKDELFSGSIGLFVPMDRLWAVGDVYLMRNSESKNIFYYRTTTSLNLSTIDTGNDFGELQTTFGGDVVDMLPYDDVFYIYGTTGIEVWQNVGAEGFPFRKQPYLSIPYHSPPSAGNNSYQFPIKYWDYYRDGFVAIAYSNQANELALLFLKGGHSQVLPVSWRKFYNILSVLSDVPTTIVDYGIGVQNLWGKEYIGISLITDLTTGIAAQTIFLDDKLNFFTIDDLLSTHQTFFLQASSTNGLNVFFDSSLNEIRVDTAEAFPIAVPTGNTYQMDSQVLESQGTILSIEKLLIELEFPIADASNYPPTASYTISVSGNEGRTFDVVRTGTLITSIHTIVEKNLGSYPSAIIRFETNQPIMMLGAQAFVVQKGAG
jgi:hypothetical protein